MQCKLMGPLVQNQLPNEDPTQVEKIPYLQVWIHFTCVKFCSHLSMKLNEH